MVRVASLRNGVIVDHQRFDDLTRALFVRLPRRGLGPLALALLAALGAGTGEAKKSPGRRQKKHRERGAAAPGSRDHAHRDGHGQGNDRQGSRKDHRKNRGSGRATTAATKRTKKKSGCVGAGVSRKKPKKGKAKKCCPA